MGVNGMYVRVLSGGALTLSVLFFAALKPAWSFAAPAKNSYISVNSRNKNTNHCPYNPKVGRICQFISMKSRDTTPNTDLTYEYQRVVYDASCVDFEADSDAEIAQKVSIMWERYEVDSLRCGPMGVPASGSPLRFAIHTSFDDFISDHISLWKLDLNKVENGQTTLDFIDERVSKSNGLLRENLERYRRGFVRAGAKFAHELEKK